MVPSQSLVSLHYNNFHGSYSTDYLNDLGSAQQLSFTLQATIEEAIVSAKLIVDFNVCRIKLFSVKTLLLIGYVCLHLHPFTLSHIKLTKCL